MSLCTWSTYHFSRNGTPRNEWTSWSDVADIAKYFTFNYGAHTSFGQIYTFCINVYSSPHILVPPTKYLVIQDGEPTTPHKLATGKNISVSNLCVIYLFMCCT